MLYMHFCIAICYYYCGHHYSYSCSFSYSYSSLMLFKSAGQQRQRREEVLHVAVRFDHPVAACSPQLASVGRGNPDGCGLVFHPSLFLSIPSTLKLTTEIACLIRSSLTHMLEKHLRKNICSAPTWEGKSLCSVFVLHSSSTGNNCSGFTAEGWGSELICVSVDWGWNFGHSQVEWIHLITSICQLASQNLLDIVD